MQTLVYGGSASEPINWLAELDSAASFFVGIEADANYVVSENGEVFGPSSAWSGMRGAVHKSPIRGVPTNGYLRVKVRFGGKRKLRWIHHLTLESFGFPRKPGLQAAHKNGIRTDNRIDNLEWITPAENNSHKRAHGTLLFGDRHHASRIPESEVPGIFARLSRGESITALAREYGVSMMPIFNIKHRRRSSLKQT